MILHFYLLPIYSLLFIYSVYSDIYFDDCLISKLESIFQIVIWTQIVTSRPDESSTIYSFYISINSLPALPVVDISYGLVKLFSLLFILLFLSTNLLILKIYIWIIFTW